MKYKTPDAGDKKPKDDHGKLSLYGLSIEDAVRGAAQTGRPAPMLKQPKLKRREPIDSV
jgi:hypothetical protein